MDHMKLIVVYFSYEEGGQLTEAVRTGEILTFCYPFHLARAAS
jgi:hypothetical protein